MIEKIVKKLTDDEYELLKVVILKTYFHERAKKAGSIKSLKKSKAARINGKKASKTSKAKA